MSCSSIQDGCERVADYCSNRQRRRRESFNGSAPREIVARVLAEEISG